MDLRIILSTYEEFCYMLWHRKKKKIRKKKADELLYLRITSLPFRPGRRRLFVLPEEVFRSLINKGVSARNQPLSYNTHYWCYIAGTTSGCEGVLYFLTHQSRQRTFARTTSATLIVSRFATSSLLGEWLTDARFVLCTVVTLHRELSVETS